MRTLLACTLPPPFIMLGVSSLPASFSFSFLVLQALKSAAEEYTRVMDIVTRYALLASGRCAFSCKRQASFSLSCVCGCEYRAGDALSRKQRASFLSCVCGCKHRAGGALNCMQQAILCSCKTDARLQTCSSVCKHTLPFKSHLLSGVQHSIARSTVVLKKLVRSDQQYHLLSHFPMVHRERQEQICSLCRGHQYWTTSAHCTVQLLPTTCCPSRSRCVFPLLICC